MILINLLPHREEKRRQRKTRLLRRRWASARCSAWPIVGVWYLVLQQLTSAQQARNDFLKAEIGRLEVQIKDIATLRAEIEALKARQKAVEDLQTDRNMPVYLLDELVKQTPEGVYLTSDQAERPGGAGQRHGADQRARLRVPAQHALQLAVAGAARTGRDQDAATQPGGAAAARDQRRLFEFSMRLTLKRPQAAGRRGVRAGRLPPAPAAKKAP